MTLGQFSIVRLERDSQLLMPVFDYCMPDKECTCNSGESGNVDPCCVFRNISFPVGEFFPPNTVRTPENYEDAKFCCKSRTGAARPGGSCFFLIRRTAGWSWGS